MSKTIRVPDLVLDRLQALQGPRETIGGVVERLLEVALAWRAAGEALREGKAGGK